MTKEETIRMLNDVIEKLAKVKCDDGEDCICLEIEEACDALDEALIILGAPRDA